MLLIGTRGEAVSETAKTVEAVETARVGKDGKKSEGE